MDYEINKNTLAVLAVNANNCKIMENGNDYLVECNTYEVMDHSCEYFGSSLEGRQSGTTKLIGIRHKAPIYIENCNNIIFFPLTSPTNPYCSWISFNNISKYYATVDKKNSIIKFKNGEILEVPVSIGSLTNQILRSSLLQVVFNDRVNQNQN